jgi:hypothetical protein
LDAAADTGEVRPRLLALVLAVLLLAACGGAEEPKAPAARNQLVGTADVDAARATGRFALEPAKPIIDVARVVRLIRSELQPTARAATVRCGAPRVRVVEVGAAIACTITLGDAVQKVRAVVKDLKGTVVVRG